MQHNAMQRNSTDTTQHRHNGSQHNATQHKTTQGNTTQGNTTQWTTTQRSTTQQTQQNSPQHNKTGNKNHAHMLNKPVKVTLSSTKNSTGKKRSKNAAAFALKKFHSSKFKTKLDPALKK